MTQESPIFELFSSRIVLAERSNHGLLAPICVQTGAGKTYWSIRVAAHQALRSLRGEGRFSRLVYSTPRLSNLQKEFAEFFAAVISLRDEGVFSTEDADDLLWSSVILPGQSDIVMRLLRFIIQPANVLPEIFPVPDVAAQALDRGLGHTPFRSPPPPAAIRPILKNLFQDAYGDDFDEASFASVDMRGFLENCARTISDIIRKYDIPERVMENLQFNLRRISSSYAFAYQRRRNAEAVPDASSIGIRILDPSAIVSASTMVFCSSMRLAYPLRGGDDLLSRPGSIIFLDESDSARSEFLRAALSPFSEGQKFVDLLHVTRTLARASGGHFGSPPVDMAIDNVARLAADILEKHHLDGVLRYSPALHDKIMGCSPLLIGAPASWLEKTPEMSGTVTRSGKDTILRATAEGKTGEPIERFIITFIDDFDFELMKALDAAVNRLIEMFEDPSAAQHHYHDHGGIVEESLIGRREAVWRIFAALGMAERHIVDIIMPRLPSGRKKRIGLLTTPQESGIRMTKIIQKDVIIMRSRARLEVLSAASGPGPEALLHGALEAGNLVFAISATAFGRTVTGNFDLDYVRERSMNMTGHDPIIPISSEEAAALQMAYRAERAYDDALVDGFRFDVKVIFDPAEGPFLSFLSHLLTEQHGPDRARDVIRKLRSGNGTSFMLKRVMKVSEAIKRFLTDDDGKDPGVVMITYLSAKMGGWRTADGQSIDCPSPEDLVRAYADHVGSAIGKSPRLIPLYAANLKEDQDYLSEHYGQASERSPLIVLTTPSSSGIGSNLQRFISENSEEMRKLIRVGPLRSAPQVDIDAVYVEMPTNLVISSGDGEGSDWGGSLAADAYTIDLLRATHHLPMRRAEGYLASLVAGGDDARATIKVGVNKTEDYRNKARSLFQQILGRMSRTPLRRRTVRVMIEQPLADIVSTETYGDRFPGAPANMRDLVSWEYARCVEACRRAIPGAGLRPPPETHQSHTIALQQRRLKSILEVISEGAEAEGFARGVRLYDTLRERMRKKPDGPSYDLDYQVRVVDKFWVGGDGDPTNPENEIREKTTPGYREIMISEEASGLPLLMLNPDVKMFFERKGYATSWDDLASLISPVFFSVYRGAIGESAFEAIAKAAGLSCSPTPLDHCERYDLLCEGLPIDVKFYGQGTAAGVDIHEMMAKTARKLKSCGHDAGAIINLVSDVERSSVSRRVVDGVEITVISGIIGRDGRMIEDTMRSFSQYLRARDV